MRRKRCLIVAILLGTALAQDYSAPRKAANPVPAAQPTARCPWLTEGSAEAALGGEVRSAVTLAGPSHGTCSFTRVEEPGSGREPRQTAPADELKIVVGPSDVPLCSANAAKVVGVGTRASRCQINGSGKDTGSASGSGSAEMISGAVRETRMAVLLSVSAAHANKAAGQAKHDTLEEIAEQVAGNLF